MSFLVKLLIFFLAITGGVSLSMGLFDVTFLNKVYWDNHGLFFLLFITLFPRLTLLFSSVASGGVIWWIGWLFAPRILVAILATLSYWHQNPILVVFSWLIALGGESGEKHVIATSTIRHWPAHHRHSSSGHQTIEAEFRHRD